MLSIITHGFIILTSNFIYQHIYKEKHSRKYHALFMLNIFLTLLIVYFADAFIPYITPLIVIIFFIFFYQFTHNIFIDNNISATIIAFSISYVIFTVSATLVAIFIATLFNINVYTENRMLVQLITCIVHIILCSLIFSSKRLRNGLPSLCNKLTYSTTISFGIAMLFIYVVLHGIEIDYPFLTLLCTLFILLILNFTYWRNTITRTYHDKRRDRDLDILNEHLDDLEANYQKMTEDKDELARIVHRDNKLVPAMLLSVETFLTEFPDATPQMKKRGDELMTELREAAEGRKGIILQQDKKCTAKPIETGISALDEVLKYMQKKAMDKNITLSASADLGIEDLVAKTISNEDLKTLTNDLLENAIIATSYNNGTNVYFIIGYFDKRLAIHVYDSGIPFTKEVLVDLGVTKHTTHEEDGGSGIGSMEIFKIARKYRASYIIDEYDTYAGPYTKRISIIFDKRNKYTLNTSRPQDEINYLRQRADLTIYTKKDTNKGN